MIINLQPHQISAFWDAIKEALVQANAVPIELQADYTNSALEKLLAGKFQAWLAYRLTDEGKKNIHAVIITSLVEDQLFGFRTLIIHSLYSYRLIKEDLIAEAMEQFKEFARANDCQRIQAETNNDRTFEIMRIAGFTKECERHTIML